MVNSENTCLWRITYSNHVLQTTRLESPLGAPSRARSSSIPNLATRRRLAIQLHAPVLSLEEILGTHWTENWKSGETYVSLFRDRSLLVQLEVSLLHSATDNYCSEQNKGVSVNHRYHRNPSVGLCLQSSSHLYNRSRSSSKLSYLLPHMDHLVHTWHKSKKKKNLKMD
jgi:hypothetical protein